MPARVSVAVITYNHARYIAQALDSVLMQRTNFDFEVVVGEDCSPDQTRAILKDYQNRHPSRIRLLLPEKNQGATRNFAATILACTGEYIALLEGDDYWSHPDKLQTQVDYLDAHPELTACFTGSQSFSMENGEVIERIRPHVEKPVYHLTDLLQGEFFPTAATMFRRSTFGGFPDWFYRIDADFMLALHVLNAEQGGIGFIDQDMSVYRRHEEGMWSGASRTKRVTWNARSFALFDSHLNRKYTHVIRLTERYWRAAVAHELHQQTAEARDLLRLALSTYRRDPSVPLSRLLGLGMKLYLPNLHAFIFGLRDKLKPVRHTH